MTVDAADVKREHHFCLAVAKHVFAHDKHGIVFVQDPITIKAAAKYHLKPLLLYGITAAGTQVRYVTFSRADKPRSICGVLSEAWQNPSVGLRGYPDILKVNKVVAQAAPQAIRALKEAGIEVAVADGKDRQFSSVIRSLQSEVRSLSFQLAMPDKQFLNSLELLNRAALARHFWDIEFGTGNAFGHREMIDRSVAFLKHPFRRMNFHLPDALDWTPGDWLFAWEKTLPPERPRYFLNCRGEYMALITGEPEDVANSRSPWEDSETDFDNGRFAAKSIVDCWPNTATEIAQSVGLTGRELQWFLTGKANIDAWDLRNMLAIKLGDSGYYDPVGPCVLMAKSLKPTVEAYQALGGGGDTRFSFEAIPEKIPADPSWRYVLFRSWNLCILMVPRGSVISERLNEDTFINFNGPLVVPDAFYRDVVSTCARACLEPEANVKEARFFERKYFEYLDSLETW